MTNKNIHTVPAGKNWAVKEEGRIIPISVHRTKAEAEKSAVYEAKARCSEHIIHDRYGKIMNKDSYGNDPFPPRDKKR